MAEPKWTTNSVTAVLRAACNTTVAQGDSVTITVTVTPTDTGLSNNREVKDAAITQRFGVSTYEGEPPGFLWPDGSVSYFTVGEGTIRHDHVHSGIDVGLTEGTPLTAPSGGR